jgi:hypothetical protein
MVKINLIPRSEQSRHGLLKLGLGAALAAISIASAAAGEPPREAPAADYFNDRFTAERVLDWGSRPIWSPDSKRIVFTRDDKQAGPAYELDLRTKKVTCLTCRWGDAGRVLRIYYLPDNSFLILGPPGMAPTKDAASANAPQTQSGTGELYWMPADASRAPQALNAPAFGEIALDYALGPKGEARIAWGEFVPQMRMSIGNIVHDGASASLTNRTVAYTYPPADPQSLVTFTETYDFLTDENAILFFTVEKGLPNNGMYKISLSDGRLTRMPTDGQHNETHVFPNLRYGLEESNRASDSTSPLKGMSAHPKAVATVLLTHNGVPNAAELGQRYGGRTFDLFVVDWRTGQRRRLTHVSDLGGQAHQSSTARNGRQIVFEMMAPKTGPFAGKTGLYVGTFSAK